MNINPAGIPVSAAGAPLSQTAGPSSERAAADASAQRRAADSEAKADDAAGIGETEQDEQTSDRDADGRRLWEGGPSGKQETEESPPPRLQKDPDGDRGSSLDLLG